MIKQNKAKQTKQTNKQTKHRPLLVGSRNVFNLFFDNLDILYIQFWSLVYKENLNNKK